MGTGIPWVQKGWPVSKPVAATRVWVRYRQKYPQVTRAEHYSVVLALAHFYLPICSCWPSHPLSCLILHCLYSCSFVFKVMISTIRNTHHFVYPISHPIHLLSICEHSLLDVVPVILWFAVVQQLLLLLAHTLVLGLFTLACVLARTCLPLFTFGHSRPYPNQCSPLLVWMPHTPSFVLYCSFPPLFVPSFAILFPPSSPLVLTLIHPSFPPSFPLLFALLHIE